ncbi:MAG: hypothetical protein SGJ02_07410 [bacterium]|nr:hypothetical protein [bacterium]
MNSLIVGVLYIIFIAPLISLDWKGNEKKEFIAKINLEKDACSKESLKEGFGAKYRFKIRVCQNRSNYGEYCGKIINEIRDLKFDPVTEKYKVAADRLEDEIEPRSVTFESKAEALNYLSKIDSISVSDLQGRSPRLRFEVSERFYLRARVSAECKGKVEKVFSWIPHLFTFGIVNRKDFDTGWLNFKLR